MINEPQFSEDEIDKAKKNTFILLGNTGNGKSSLTNLLCKSKAKVSSEKKSMTQKADSYFGKLDSNNYFCVIDTPGFSDSEGKDSENYETIKNYLIDSKLLIKGIYIICNFQDERFNEAEQKSVKAISDLFPLKNFWNYVTIIFTHYFNKGCDSRVKIKNSQVFQESLKQTKEKLMKDAYERNYIDIISHDRINTLYIDIYNDIEENNINLNNSDNLDDDEKEELESLIKKKKENERAYNELAKDIKNKISQDPLYDKVIIEEKQKVTLFEEIKNGTSYALYDAEIEKRLFYLGNELLALDLKLISEPIFRKNTNKFWDDFKSFNCYINNEKDLVIQNNISFITISNTIIPVSLLLVRLGIFYYINKNLSLNLKMIKEIYSKE